MLQGANRVALAVGRLSPRERWLLAAALLGLLGGGAYQAMQWADAERARYELAEADLVLASQNRAAQARSVPDAFDRAQLKALAEWSEHGASLWLVRLKVEQRLVEAAADAGLKDARVKLAEATEGDAAAPLLRGEVNGSYRGSSVARLLKRLSEDRAAFVVDRLEVDQANAPEFKLELLFPIQIDAPQARP